MQQQQAQAPSSAPSSAPNPAPSQPSHQPPAASSGDPEVDKKARALRKVHNIWMT